MYIHLFTFIYIYIYIYMYIYLGLTLANIFVGFCEANSFNKIDCHPHVLSLC